MNAAVDVAWGAETEPASAPAVPEVELVPEPAPSAVIPATVEGCAVRLVEPARVAHGRARLRALGC